MTAPILQIYPSSYHIDQEVSITVKGLNPNQKITLRAEMGEWVSEGVYQADAHGQVLLDRDAPLFGSYTTLDSMGLFWSMTHPSFPGACRSIDPRINLQLWIDGVLKRTIQIERQKSHPGIIRSEIRENGLVGTLFTSPGAASAIVILGGSSGGLAEGRAEALANHGFTTLSLAYFGYSGLPDHLEEIPLEYFEKAIAYLKRTHLFVGFYGISRGAEAALLFASHFPYLIDAVAAVVPSSVALAGFPNRSKSAWTLKNIPISHAPFEERKWGPNEGQTPDEAIQLTPLFLQGIGKPEYQKALIPVEKIECPVLLISGTDDQMWPSTFFANEAAARIGAPCTHLIYKGAGHHITYPHQPICTLDFHPTAKAWFDFGGTQEANAAANKDSWAQMIKFFSTQLKDKHDPL